MKLQQGQRWKCADNVVRIVRLERLAVEYKAMPVPVEGETVDEDLPPEGTHHKVTKKEFCRLIKGAVLEPTV